MSSLVFKRPQNKARRGFTLVEILTVIAIISVLAGITFGIMSGAGTTRDRAKAEGEIQVLASSLESFRLRYGTYPWVRGDAVSTGPNVLYLALSGREPRQGFTGGDNGFEPATGEEKPFVTGGDIRVIRSGDPELSAINARVGTTLQTPFFVDSWGNPYFYDYDRYTPEDPGGGRWENPTFILMSAGGEYLTGSGFQPLPVRGGGGDVAKGAVSETWFDSNADPTQLDDIIYGIEN